MKKVPIFMDLDREPLFNFTKPADLENDYFSNSLSELPSTKEMLQQQEATTNMKWLFINKNNPSNKDLLEFVGKNNIKVMFCSAHYNDPVRELAKDSQELATPINRTQLQVILKDNSPQKLDSKELEEVLNAVFTPILSKENFLDRVKSSKLDIFIDDNPAHISGWKNK